MSSEFNSAEAAPSEQQQQGDASSLVDEHTDKKRKFDGDSSAPSGGAGAAAGSAAAGAAGADMSEDAVRKMVNSFSYEALAQLTTLICARNADAFELLHEQYVSSVVVRVRPPPTISSPRRTPSRITFLVFFLSTAGHATSTIASSTFVI
jgi:hypothetical protein